MKGTETHPLTPILIVIAFCLGFFYAGATIGISMDKRAYTEHAYKPWEQLDGSFKFVQIIDATSDTVWAKTADGKLYYWNFYCHYGNACGKWIETGEVPASIHSEGGQLPFEKGMVCPISHSAFPKEPPPTFVECALGSYMSSVWIARYYALLDNGTIWFWDYPVGNDSVRWVDLLSIGGIFAGLTIGFIAAVNFSYSKPFALFTAFSVAGVITGIVFGVIVLYLQIAGILMFWKPIETPYKFSEIANANTERIWAKSTDGQLYMQDCEFQKGCIWIKINYEPDYSTINDQNHDDFPFKKESNCTANQHFRFIKNPSQDIVECTFVWNSDSDVFRKHGHGRYIALLNNGTISSLQYSNEIRRISLLPYVPYGFGLGTILFINYWMTQRKVSKTDNKDLL